MFSPRERISFFVGSNGCGKTHQLIKMQAGGDLYKGVAAITNTPFNKFSKSSSKNPVLRVSPYGVVATTTKNLVNFVDAINRDTFNISDLLNEIGFDGEVKLDIKINNKSNIFLEDIIRDENEQSSVLNILESIRGEESVQIPLNSYADSFTKSLRGRNRILLKNLSSLKKRGILDNYELVFYNKIRGYCYFSDLSSGEQTLISTFLFIRSLHKNIKLLLIDEPENSLHPKWQRKYLEFIHMAIGYRELNIVIATHSPVVVSGAVESYGADLGVYSVARDGDFSKINIASHDESVEEILLDAFNTITPSNTYLAEKISEITWDIQEGKINKTNAIAKLEDFYDKSYSETQKKFILACKKVITKISEKTKNEI